MVGNNLLLSGFSLTPLISENIVEWTWLISNTSSFFLIFVSLCISKQIVVASMGLCTLAGWTRYWLKNRKNKLNWWRHSWQESIRVHVSCIWTHVLYSSAYICGSHFLSYGKQCILGIGPWLKHSLGFYLTTSHYNNSAQKRDKSSYLTIRVLSYFHTRLAAPDNKIRSQNQIILNTRWKLNFIARLHDGCGGLLRYTIQPNGSMVILSIFLVFYHG
jgi:hypothetical protein